MVPLKLLPTLGSHKKGCTLSNVHLFPQNPIAHIFPGAQGMASTAILLPKAGKRFSLASVIARLDSIEAYYSEKIDMRFCDDGSGDLAIVIHEANACEFERVMSAIDSLCNVIGRPLIRRRHKQRREFVEIAVPELFHRVKWQAQPIGELLH
jgi:hypothetical protein